MGLLTRVEKDWCIIGEKAFLRIAAQKVKFLADEIISDIFLIYHE
jgi:hypothetical protein